MTWTSDSTGILVYTILGSFLSCRQYTFRCKPRSVSRAKSRGTLARVAGAGPVHVPRPSQPQPRENGGKPAVHAGGDEPQSEDALPTWTREQLLEMDARFCNAIKRAIAAGLERDPRI